MLFAIFLLYCLIETCLKSVLWRYCDQITWYIHLRCVDLFRIILLLKYSMMLWFFIFVISTFHYFEVLLRALVEIELLLEYIKRSVLIIFLFVPRKMRSINNEIRINEICGRNITYTFDIIDSFNPWEIYESASIKHNTIVDLFFFLSISTKGFSSS